MDLDICVDTDNPNTYTCLRFTIYSTFQIGSINSKIKQPKTTYFLKFYNSIMKYGSNCLYITYECNMNDAYHQTFQE